MNGTKPQLEHGLPGLIPDRIGPIVDTAFLKLIPKDVLKEITLIRIRALQNTMQAELSATDQLLKVLEKVHL